MGHPELMLIFFVIAFIYASVGFGGGSSYLAILALYGLPFQEIRFIALACNIIVVAGSILVYQRNQQISWRKILPLAAASIPMAFLGATLKLSEDTFFILLGATLLIASVLLWINTKASKEPLKIAKPVPIRDAALGGSIGLLSGMVGIGGGIFLSPLLNLTKWDTAKRIAATASVFILVNSISGIIGQLQNPSMKVSFGTIGWLSLAVLAGGQLGARTGAIKFNQLMIRRVTAVLVLIAGIEVLHKHLPWFK
jgi:uncharacterized membrane protein YfcA